jgi:hypothetical protein
MTWAPEITSQTVILRVPAFIEAYAAVILQETLPEAVGELSRSDGEVLKVIVQPGERQEDAASVSFEPGQVVVTADRLTERFDPSELRARVDELVNEAVLEGDAWAERDAKRARAFLNDLAAEPQG